MTTRQADIRDWLKRAPDGATHMLVVCDMFDWSDYPVFVTGIRQGVQMGKPIRATGRTCRNSWRSITFRWIWNRR